MSSERELKKELRQFFPEADIQINSIGVSITQDTFYSIDRHELARLEQKYKTGLFCDARDRKVYYLFHTFGGW